MRETREQLLQEKVERLRRDLHDKVNGQREKLLDQDVFPLSTILDDAIVEYMKEKKLQRINK